MRSTPPVRYGRDNNRYNGGLCFNKQSRRWLVCCRDGSLMLYSRGVMAAQIGRLLTSAEIVHHKDEDTTNDDPSNLEIVTRAQHIAMHRGALLAGMTWPTGDSHPNAKVTEAQIAEIRRRREAGENARGLAREFGVNVATVYSYARGRGRRAA